MGIIIRIIKVILILFILGLTTKDTFAQDGGIKRSGKVTVIENKKYYLHTIEKGQTLYAISKAYDVAVNDIVIENPDLIDGLPLNREIKIPFKEVKKAEVTIPPGTYGNHVVEKGETLYSISKKYNLRIEHLAAANPEAQEGVKKGQILRIPVQESQAQAQVPPGQTITVAPVDTTRPQLKSTYNVFFFLPFFTSMNDDEKEYKNANDKLTIYPKSEVAVAFYLGAMEALDSVKKTGLSVKAYFIDTANDSLVIEQTLRKPELKEADLIIGPFYSTNFARVADFARKNKIAIVSPFSQINKILLNNLYISKVTPSPITQIEQQSLYISEKYKFENVILLHKDSYKERQYVEVFKKRTGCYPDASNLTSLTVKELTYKKETIENISSSLSVTKKNIFFIPTTDQATVTEIISSLYANRNNYDIMVFGMDNWNSFDNIDPDYLQALKVHVPSAVYVDYNQPSVKRFIRNYREKNQSEPEKFAFYGFDITLYYLKALQKYGHNFTDKLPELKTEGLQSRFDFIKTGVESGYENKGVYILQYEDFQQKKVN